MARTTFSRGARLAGGLLLGLAAAAPLVWSASAAQEPAAGDINALLRHHGCHACHAVDDTLLGPSFRSIATMHGARKDVMTEVLAQKIIHGGAGNWGIVPMPPNERVSLPEARAIAAWVLAQEQR